ncbi:MAG: biotin--[acetyl-CoA-carboxylase] ligase [Oscillospiraceae bacterium]|nr:biotin--[acetyl-CoA-carboxylase] ligase [Oscillospiraceae bacterium]
MSEIIFLKETSSTNDWLRARCGTLSDMTCVTAERQTAGRGRRGHSWETSDGMLAMSVLLKDPPDVSTLTARVGLAVCDAISELYSMLSEKAGIKWPNDIIIENHKVCGILCESVKIGDCVNVICGIGVNVSQSEEYFNSVGLANAASLKMLSGIELSKKKLCEKIFEKTSIRAKEMFCACYEEYKDRVINIGREVRILRGDNERRATAVDIAQNGCLICEDESGRFEVSSGEVSIRGIEGYL